MLIVIPRTSPACVDKQFVDGVLGHVCDPRGCTNAVTFNKQADDQGASFGVQFSHKLNVSDRMLKVKHNGQFNKNVKAVIDGFQTIV